MAESVMNEFVRRAGLEDGFTIDSAAATSDELGNPPHSGTVAKLHEVGIPVTPHRARLITKDELAQWDRIVCMDEENLRDLRRIFGRDAAAQAEAQGRIAKLLAFVPEGSPLDPPARDAGGRIRDVADPWFTGNFDATYRDVLAGCKGLLELETKLG